MRSSLIFKSKLRGQKASVLGKQTVLDGEEAPRNAVFCLDFAVDVLDVVAGRLRRHEELLGNLLRREPTSEKAQHLNLPCRQASRTVTTLSRAVPSGAQDCFHHVVIQFPCSGLFAHETSRVVRRMGRSVRPKLPERLIHIRRSEDAARA